MLASKIITFLEPVDLDVVEVTLLSAEEYATNKDIIPPTNKWWWLRSPGTLRFNAVYVRCDGNVGDRNVNHVGGYIRPALRIRNLKSSNIPTGSKFKLAECTWTVLLDDLALCDEEIDETCFREHLYTEDANIYEKSDIKKYLEKWAKEVGIL